MAQDFKKLAVWERADKLAHTIFDITDNFPKNYLFDLTSQLRRAALSIPTNIVEGCASFHSKEFLQFINIARRSANETQYLILFAFKQKLVNNDVYNGLTLECEEISKMLSGLRRSIKENEDA